MPIERVKNIVSFSFQHAPLGMWPLYISLCLFPRLNLGLDVLESSCIAWPNNSMWRRAPWASSMPVPSYPSDDPDSHAHSPRRRISGMQGNISGYYMPGIQGVMGRPSTSSGMRCVTHPVSGTLLPTKTVAADTFGDVNPYYEWLSAIETGVNGANRAENQANPPRRITRRMSTDISMPDYTASLESGDQLAPPGDRPFLNASLRQDEDDASGHLKVPANTPTTSGQGSHEQDGTGALEHTRV